jgi:hypothetical protein
MTKETRLRAIQNQIRRLERQWQSLQTLSDRYAWLRLAIVAAGLVFTVSALFFVGGWLFWICGLVTALLFGLTAYLHRRVDDSIRRHRIWHGIQTEQVARATLDWTRIPAIFPQQPRPEHPFELDLDLVGPRSLHRLLDRATTHGGSRRLRDWLTVPEPEPREITRRQELVRELAPRCRFRDRLTLNATVAAGGHRAWRAEHLLDWLARHPPQEALRRWLYLFAGLAALNASLVIANRLGRIPPWWQITFALYLLLWLARGKIAEEVWNEALSLQGAFRQLGAVLGQLERLSYRHTPHLAQLCAPFLDPAHRPSLYLARISRLVAAMGLRANPLLAFLLNALVPWDFYFAYRLSRYKADLAGRVPAWLEIWFDLEAISSLANLAYLNPGYVLPIFLPGVESGRPVFQAQGLGHPLIPTGEKVCNDFSIPELGRVAVITGSNMAGKTVFMKTVGANLALAQAGGPVDALSLETLPFRLFTSMRIADSVTDGISYFYAEVRRLKALLGELAGDHGWPLFYFIDEILRGTNNRERRLGSRAYVSALAGRAGVGLIATHDLELAGLADEVPQVRNYHFRDQVAGGRMIFDYLLRSGPSPTTNALRIMQMEGLPIPENTKGG